MITLFNFLKITEASLQNRARIEIQEIQERYIWYTGRLCGTSLTRRRAHPASVLHVSINGLCCGSILYGLSWNKDIHTYKDTIVMKNKGQLINILGENAATISTKPFGNKCTTQNLDSTGGLTIARWKTLLCSSHYPQIGLHSIRWSDCPLITFMVMDLLLSVAPTSMVETCWCWTVLHILSGNYQLQVFAYVVTPRGVRGQVPGSISSNFFLVQDKDLIDWMEVPGGTKCRCCDRE
jgi:hypothetical protein